MRLVPALFDERASRQPGTVALAGAGTEITYGQIARESSQLAHYLRGIGIGQDSVVGVCLDRGAEVIRCLLAILKAGGAYLPLDPSLPQARLTRMCQQAGARFVLAGHADAGHGFTGATGPRLIDVRQVTLDGPGGTPPQPGPLAADLAYAICTSGSTGQPKAVGVCHGSLARAIPEIARAYQVSGDDRILQMASLGFDTSIEQILVTLLSGATLVLPPADPLAPADLPGYLAEQRITVVDLTPAYWHRMLATTKPSDPRLRTLRLMITGGDAASPGDCVAAMAAAPHARLLNAYGLTETTITSTLFEVSPEFVTDSGPVPVGVPLPHAQVLVLDPERRPVPAGTTGEVYIAGPGLARGYLGLPGLTQERFVANPDDGARMFRTGDLGRLRPDGNLEVTGRVDRMLKIRGFRVEPAEIETVLATLPAIDQVAVVAHDVAHGDKRLVAYYTQGLAPADTADLRRSVAARLPAFMVPAAFVGLDHMPLTNDGRIDRQALEHPVVAGGHSPDGETYTLTQAGMSHLWSTLLGNERVDLDDDFFRLGGNSLLAAEMLAHARVMFGIGADQVRSLTRGLLRDPTLRGFCAATEDIRGGRAPTSVGDIDIAVEAELGVPVVTSGAPTPDWRDPRAILLTGATGFFGVHLLRELLNRTTARIYCLVRADSPSDAVGRITSSARRYEVEALDMERTVMVLGDLAEAELGLRAGELDELARTVDVIYHLGATVNFIYPYEELRAANVGGTRELIRLAGRYRCIPVHYVSSTAVLAGFGVAGVRVVTEDEPLAHAQQLSVGYVQSKYVAEELLRNASRVGLPVAIYRPMDIVGGAPSAAWNTGTEMCALIRFMADSGTAPDIDLPLDFVPADVFAAALTHISTTTQACGQTFHIAAPECVPLGFLVERMRRHGFPITPLPYRDWVHELLRYAAGNPSHPMTPFVPLFVDRCAGTDLTIAEMYLRHVFPSYTRSNTERALHGSGIEFPFVRKALIDRTLKYLIATGFLTRAPLHGLALLRDAAVRGRSPGRLLRGPEPGQRPDRLRARPHPVPRRRRVCP